jgi:UDP-N-acetylglucosamine 2-epimerase (non-hydrolysing)/UDP-N-acetylglucosamine 2-epimerase (hydrolysing)
MTTYLACIGTRAEIIAMAALHRVLRSRGDRLLVLHLGPHKAMSDLLYRFFDMGPFLPMHGPPEGAMPPGGMAQGVAAVAAAMEEAQVDAVVVQGAARHALLATLAADRLGLPVAHLEVDDMHSRASDAVSGELGEPVSAIIRRLARWHFVTTDALRQRLLRVGAPQVRVHLVGNPVIDTALWVRAHMARPGFDNASALPLNLRGFLRTHPASRLLLVTAESRDNGNQPVLNIAHAVSKLLQQQPDLIVVWPLRPGLAVRGELERVLERLKASCRDRICLTDPLDYPGLIAVLAQCHITLTDDGGTQQEASALARPVLLAGEEGSDGAGHGARGALVQAGGARWVGNDTGRIVDETVRLLTQYTQYRAMQLSASPFGDGQAARRMADILSASVHRCASATA